MKTNNILLGAAAALAAVLLIKRKQQADGVGALNNFKVISMAQKMGIDLTQDVHDLTDDEKRALNDLARQVSYRQSKKAAAEGWLPGESLYKSLRTQYKKIVSVSGLEDTYTELPISDEEGNVVLIYRDYTDSPALRAIRHDLTFSAENSQARTFEDGYWGAVDYIASGGKFIWSNTKRKDGLKEQLIATRTSANQDRKQYLSILASKEKGGTTIERLAEQFTGKTPEGYNEVRDGILEALRQVHSKKQALSLFQDLLRQQIEQEQAQERNMAFTDADYQDDLRYSENWDDAPF